MIAAGFAAGMSTIATLILHLTGHLRLWHQLAAGLVASVFESFQFSAYPAVISTRVERKHDMRANGMLETAGSASGIIARREGDKLVFGTAQTLMGTGLSQWGGARPVCRLAPTH
jgi:hypothetical protein